MPRHVVLAIASEPQATILHAALSAHGARGLTVDLLPPGAHLESAALQAMRAARDAPPLLLVDVVALAQLASCADDFCDWKRAHCNGAELLFYCSGLYAAPAHARAWAQRLGARDLLPGCDLAHWRTSLLPTLTTTLNVLGAGAADEAATEKALRALPALLDHTTQVAHAWRQHDALQALGTSPPALVKMLAEHLDIGIRRYRVNSYSECFVGTDAVERLAGFAKAVGAPHTRADMLPLGQALLDLGYLYHVARDQPFRDGHFFYRIAADTPRLNALDLGELTQRMRQQGVPILDRKFHGVVYPMCFVGSAAVAWLRKAYRLTENEAMTLGQRLVDLFIVHHVVDQRPFRDGKFFYRFFQDER